MLSQLVILGAGGHASVVADLATLANRFVIIGFLDDVHPERHGTRFCGATILGGAEHLQQLAQSGVRHAFVAVGDCDARMLLAEQALRAGLELPVLCHPSAIAAGDASIGAGSMLAAGSIVNAAAVVGDNVIINTAASVDHECTIEDGAHIGPGARLGGRVVVGRCTWIGIGAVVKDHVRIGAGSIVGAGAVVVDDVPDATIAYGNPARIVRPVSRAEATRY